MYPEDIKSTTNLSKDQLREAVGVMQHTIRNKNEKIREISKANRVLTVNIENLKIENISGNEIDEDPLHGM